jgi:hypothetical protein
VRASAVVGALVVLSACGGGDGGVPQGPTPDVPGCTTTQVPLEPWVHVAEGSALRYQSDPPSSGAHYPTWARYAEYETPVQRGHYVHNLEHGAIVVLYRPDAPAPTVDALRGAFRSVPDDPACGHKRALLTPDPLMQPQTAVVAAGFVLSSNCVDATAIRAFVAAHRGRGPEDVCAHGSRP